MAVIAGVVFGPLAERKRLLTADGDGLGALALESEGSFAVARLGGDGVVVVTDAGGSVPVYYADGPRGTAVGTLVHHVAAAAGCTEIDEVSVVDHLLNATVCYPYTWYEGVRMAPPGSVLAIWDGAVESRCYYTPREPDDLYAPCDMREWGEALRTTTASAVRAGISGKASGRVMYSGGADSRAVLSLIPDTFPCVPTTVLDAAEGNHEYELARRSARALGRELEWIPRPEGFYRSGIEERIDLIGPGLDFRHTHIFGPIAERFADVDVVLGGFMANSLFKTFYMANVERRGSLLPDRLLAPGPETIGRPEFESELTAFWNERAAAVRKRRVRHHERLKQFRPRTAGNWHRLWPLSNAPLWPHYMACQRMGTTVVEPFLFNQSYQLAARLPDRGRIEGRGFRRAFAREMGRAGYVRTTSGRIPRLRRRGIGGAFARVLTRGLRSIDSVKRRIVGEEVPQGPWSPDSGGWVPVRPENHYSPSGQRTLRERLGSILASSQVPRFFESESVPDDMRVRALSTGFTASKLAAVGDGSVAS